MGGRFCGIFARRRGALGRRWEMGLDTVFSDWEWECMAYVNSTLIGIVDDIFG